MKRIYIADTYAIVDDEDYELVRHDRWSLNKGYAVARVPGLSRSMSMHVLIMDPPPGMEVDHIDPGDTLDNRRSNLRLATRRQNAANQLVRKNNTSGYKGVVKQRDKWVVRIMVDRKQLYVGQYETIEEAAEAYNVAAIQHFGEFANLNEIPA